MLLEAGADPNGEAAQICGRTALQGAAEHGRLDILQLLLDSGAEIRGWPARKAKRLAEREGHAVVAQILGRRIEELGAEQDSGVSSDEESTDDEELTDYGELTDDEELTDDGGLADDEELTGDEELTDEDLQDFRDVESDGE